MPRKAPKLQGPTSILPIIYGSVAFYLGSNAPDGSTHRWTIYIRGVGGVDLSTVVSRVVFQLHPSCEIPVVDQSAFPFETTQNGWGEFQALIHVHFADASLGQVTLSHTVQLYPEGTKTPSPRPVVKEFYDEIVFAGVPLDFQTKLDALRDQPCPSNELASHWLTFSEMENVASISRARALVTDELAKAKQEITRLDAELAKAEKLAKAEAAAAQAAAAALQSEEAVNVAMPDVQPSAVA
jgi:YEATS domain-containing protein 4